MRLLILTLLLILCYSQPIVNEVVRDDPALSIKLLNDQGAEVTDIETIILLDIPTIRIIITGTYNSLTISPPLPEGIAFLNNSMVISGGSIYAREKTVFSVIASNGEESVQSIFTLTVPACVHGSYLYGDDMTESPFNLTLSKNGEIVYHVDNVYGVFAIATCIMADTYDYSLSCLKDDSDCSVRMYDQTHMTHMIINAASGKTVTGKIKMYVNTLPEVTMGKDEFFLTHQDQDDTSVIGYGYSSIKLIHDDVCKPSYYEDDQVVIIFATSPGIYHLVFNITNSFGFILKHFTVYSDRCRIGDSFIQYIVNNNYNTIPFSLQIASTNGTVLTERTDDLTAFYCVADGDYDVSLQITMTDTEFVKDMCHFTIRDENWNAIYQSYFHNGVNNIRERIHVAPFIRSDSNLLVSEQFLDSWNKDSFNDAKWEKVKQGEWGKWNSLSTIYFRTSISIAEPGQYTVFLLDVTLREGVVVYVNGEEAYRTGLPTGQISHDTKATVLMMKKQTYTSSFAPSLFRKGANLIAVELHRSDKTSSDDVVAFSVGLTTSTASCHVSRYPGAATSVDSTSVVQNAGEAFSLDNNEEWKAIHLPVSLTYAFNNHTTHFFNQVTIASTENIKKDMPANFKVVGVRDNGVEDVLATVASCTLFGIERGLVTIPLNNHRSYSIYRFHFTAANNGTSIRIFHIFFSVCDSRNCPKNRVGVLPVNGYVDKKCTWFKRGVRRVRCERQFASLSVVTDDSECLRIFPPGSESYIDMTFRITDCSVERWTRFVETAMKKVVTEQLIVREDQMLITNIREYSDSISFITSMSMRFHMEAEIGDFVLKHLDKLLTNITSKVQDAMKSGSIGTIYVVEDPVLHGPVSTILIMLVILAITNVVTLIIVFILWRKRSGQVNVKSLKKTLNRSKGKLGGEKEGLI